MFLTFINSELWTTLHFTRRAAVGLRDNSCSPFPDLIHPLPGDLLTLSVSLSTPPLYVGFHRQSLPMWPSRLQLKQLIIVLALGTGNLSGFVRLLAVWPNLLHLLHLKVGPLTPEEDLSFAERRALSSSDI